MTQIKDVVMDEPRYLPNVVARAAGIPLATLRNWERSERQLIRRETGRRFSFRRALQVALTGALVNLGARPEFAARVALSFTDSGGAPLPGRRPGRHPGELFDKGWTILAIYPGEVFDVKNVMPETAAIDLFTPLGHTRSDAATILNVTFLVQRFRCALDGDQGAT